MTKALVLGPTGLVGHTLVEMLLKDPDFSKVITYTRRPLLIDNEKYEEHIVDYKSLNSQVDVDVIFCCLGTTIKTAGSKDAFKKIDCEYPLKIAKLQQTNSSKFLIISALGASEKSAFFYSQVKGEVEAALSHLNYESLIIFRPSLIAGKRAEHRPGEEVAALVMKAVSPLLLGPLRRYRPVSPTQIALGMIDYVKKGIKGKSIVESEVINSY